MLEKMVMGFELGISKVLSNRSTITEILSNWSIAFLKYKDEFGLANFGARTSAF